MSGRRQARGHRSARRLGLLLAGLTLASVTLAQEAERARHTSGTRIVPDAAARLVAPGAVLELEAGSVASAMDLVIVPLAEADLRPLRPGMTNVTAGAHRGLRFGPQGARFEKPLRLSLAYDPRLFPPGTTEHDARAFYFDEDRGRWIALERVAVVPSAQTVVSLTDHFTDVIVATLATPSHPGVESFVPSRMQDMKAAHPSEGLALVAPPESNPLGEARLSLPIELPPGRNGVQPSLALRYSSQGGNGWLGVGWDLQLPQIEVETRWGVPRYGRLPDDAGVVAYRDLETESYLLDGLALTPVAHRTAFEPRSGEARVFHARVEGAFERVVRHGSRPSEFWWEVTDRNGVRALYGEPPGSGPGPGALRDDAGNVFRWALRESRDAHGNTMRFHYDLVSHAGVPGGSVPGRQLYLRAIEYTGRTDAAGGHQPGAYTVRFLRDSDPGIPDPVRREDVAIDCRGGFKQVTADLLRGIRVELLGERIREYQLSYDTGVFGRTRLVSVRLLGSDGRPFPGGEHRFTWFDDVRDGSGGYAHGFEAATRWSVPFDDVSLCQDLGPVSLCPTALVTDHDRASALSGAVTHGWGGHLYLGLNCGLPTKQNSAGIKAGFERTRTNVRLGLLDVNGDNLPDKVFRSGSGFAWRANESRPDGRAGFSDVARPLTGVSELSIETSTSGNGGAEQYFGGTSTVVNVSYGQSLGSTYSTDANGDGFVDFVRDGTILYSHLDESGAPRFEPTSANTPLPLAPGTADGGGLIGDYEPQFQDQVDQHPLVDVFRRWTAPYDGAVAVGGGARLASPADSEDGVRVSVQHNGVVLWSAHIPPGDAGEHLPAGLERVAVARGDRLYFRVQSVFDGTLDEVAWDPEIHYLDVPPAPDANRLDAHRYRASADFVLAGRSGSASMPHTGRVRVTGVFEKPDTTTDDVAVCLRRSGIELFRASLPWDSVGAVTLDVAFDVAGDDTSTHDVNEADRVHVRIEVDSPVDAARLGWRADAPPELVYESVAGHSLHANSAAPVIAVLLPSDLDLYPDDGLTAPQQAWEAPSDGTIRVRSRLAGDWSFRRVGVEDPVLDGQIVFTVKRAGARLGKRALAVVGGRAANETLEGLVVARGDRLQFDFSMREAGSRGSVGAEVTYEGTSGGAVSVPCALHTNVDFDDVAALGRGLFGQPNRGWTCAGYNGNPERWSPERPQSCVRPRPTPTAALDEAALVLSESLVQLARPASPDVFSAAADTTLRAWAMSPVHERLPDGTLRAYWRGPAAATFVAAAGASASRLGSPMVGVPCPGDVGDGSGQDARAVPRIGNTLSAGLGGGFIITVAGSVGRTASDLDFLDLNGDQFPDLVGHAQAQYTLPNGGLEAKVRTNPGVDTLRRAFNLAGSVSIGGSIPIARGGSRGTAGANSTSAPKGERTQNLMISLGFSGEVGVGQSTVRADLLDVNGDGLPDRVLHDGSVGLNLGYSFATPEVWPGFDGLDQSTSLEGTLAAGIGYNDLIYGWAGGLSYTGSRSRTRRSLQDLNGDGLPDQLRDDSGTLRVAFNAGSRFLPEVAWHGATVDELSRTVSANLGGGGFITIPVPIFLCSPVTVLFLIINPGAMVSASMTRQEEALMDVDGDGFADHVTSTRDDELVVARNRTGRSNLLQSVERPLGGRIALDYERLGNTSEMPRSLWALARVELEDGVPDDGPSPLLTTYAYDSPRYDRGEREFYGFGQVTERHRAAGPAEPVARTVARTYRNESFYSRGLLVSEVTSDADGRALRGAEFAYQFRDVGTGDVAATLGSRTATLFPMRVRAETRVVEGQPAQALGTRRDFTYDEVGNVVHVADAGGPGSGDELEATLTYASCGPDGLRSVPERIVITGADGSRTEREATVDCLTGDVLQHRTRLADGSLVVTDLAWSPDGAIRSMTGPPNLHGQREVLRYEHDPVTGTHVTRIEDHFGLASTATHDLRFARPLSVTDANGNVTSYTYDAFGRPATVTGPYEQGTGMPTLAFEYHPEARFPWAATRHRDALRGPGDPIETYLFADGLGRVLQTKVDGTVHVAPDRPAEDVVIVSGRTRFDALGRPVEQYHPLTEPLGNGPRFASTFDPEPPSVVEYDALDRPTLSRLPDGATTRFRYGLGAARDGARAQETIIEDANGRTRTILRDLEGQVVAVREGSTTSLWTSFERDGLGRLVSITDAGGNVTRLAYDALGRRTSLVRPDAGETRYAWDLASNLVSVRTARHLARGGEISYDYDHRRRIARRHPGDDADDATAGVAGARAGREEDAPDDVTWEYGPVNGEPNAAGRVVRVKDPAGEERFAYGRLGEVVRRDRTLVVSGRGDDDLTAGSEDGRHEPRTFTTRYAYDTWGRLLELVQPDGERIRYAYDAGGLVNEVTGEAGGTVLPYVRRLEYDRFRQQAFTELGNGVTTRYAYVPENQRLARLTSSGPAGTFQDLHYAYDPVGNVLAIENAVTTPPDDDDGGPTRQDFRYDELYRLIGATGSYAFEPRKRDEYTLTMRYDALGNIVSRERLHEIVQPSGRRVRQHATSFAADYRYTPGRPHAAVEVDDRRLTYDAGGNQTGWTRHRGGARREIEWNGMDQVRSLADQGREYHYVYDADGRRAIQRGPGQETVYPTPFYSVRDEKVASSHVVVGGTRIASRVHRLAREGKGPRPPTDDEVYYLHADHLGSIQFVTDDEGEIEQHLEYFPFGEIWVEDRDGPDRVDLGFSGREQDSETGLLHFGAREQDPRLGLFLSPDPSSAGDAADLASASPATLNVYAYASGNPVRLTSPTGLAPGWWSRMSETFALFRGVGGAAAGERESGAGLFSDSDSPSNGGISGASGGFLAGAGTGVLHDLPDVERDIKATQTMGATRARSNAVTRGPPVAAADASPAGAVATRARSNAVVGEGPAAHLQGRAPVVLGENMAGRVTPYARSIGGETIVDWLAGREWTQQLNDEFIRTIMAEGREIIDIGPDFGRRLQFKLNPPKDRGGRPVYESERQILGAYHQRRQVYIRTGKYSGGVPGLDMPSAREPGVRP